jgi:hypothetical protein
LVFNLLLLFGGEFLQELHLLPQDSHELVQFRLGLLREKPPYLLTILGLEGPWNSLNAASGVVAPPATTALT